MMDFPTPTNNQRIGIHYFPDTTHYRESDLVAWLPQLKAMGVQWITLIGNCQRNIPEFFIQGLTNAGIEPIIHIRCSPASPPTPLELAPMLQAYANWGVNYVAIYHHPNLHDQWGSKSWVGQNLMLSFSEVYIPLAKETLKAGLIPVLPPLKRKGDYWDTSFLRAFLQLLLNQEEHELINRLVLGIDATSNNLPLAWGAGGPERWPGTIPYITTEGTEDQNGFRSFDWYRTISEAVLGKSLPMLILNGGSTHPDHNIHQLENEKIVDCLRGEILPDLEPIGADVLACNFWLLAASPNDPRQPNTWFQADGSVLPIVKSLKAKRTNIQSDTSPLKAELGFVPQPNPSRKDLPEVDSIAQLQPTIESTSNGAHAPDEFIAPFEQPFAKSIDKQIEHYILLPTFEWGAVDWHLEIIQPYVKKHRPTVGFSVNEALLATEVTLIGDKQHFAPDTIAQLEANGCTVRQIEGDGTSIATQLDRLSLEVRS